LATLSCWKPGFLISAKAAFKVLSVGGLFVDLASFFAAALFFSICFSPAI